MRSLMLLVTLAALAGCRTPPLDVDPNYVYFQDGGRPDFSGPRPDAGPIVFDLSRPIDMVRSCTGSPEACQAGGVFCVLGDVAQCCRPGEYCDPSFGCRCGNTGHACDSNDTCSAGGPAGPNICGGFCCGPSSGPCPL